jgi:anti-sigma factor RsiW
MTCKQLNANIDDYLDDGLSADERQALDAHLAGCGSCREIVAHENRLRDLLRDYGEATMPRADETFYDRSIAKAAREGGRRQRNRWIMTGFGGAIAAGLALWIVAGVFLSTPDVGETVPSVTMALEQPRTLNLVFSSGTALDDATMTVVLPEGVEIDGFAGQHEISWLTSLHEGRNVLPLTLIATAPVSGELLATLQHGDDSKTFRLKVTVI